MKLSEFIRKYREEHELSQRQFAKKCGVSNAYISLLENEKNPKTGEKISPSISSLKAVAFGMGISLNNLLRRIDDMSVSLYGEDEGVAEIRTSVQIPVFGRVAAGIPMEAITDVEDYEEIPAAMAARGEYFALTVKGDSMEPKISDGDVVIVRKQDCAEDGDLAVVLVNGQDATCKKIKKTPDGVMLLSTNPKYEPFYYSNEEIENLPVTVLGKVVELRAKF